MPRTRAAVVTDVAMAILTVASLALVFVEEAEADPERRTLLLRLDLALVLLFFAEWLWRARKAPKPLAWAASHSWELLGMVPLMLPVPDELRFLRITRLVRLLRLFGSVGRLFGIWDRVARDSRLAQIGAAAGGIVLLGGLAAWLVERDDPATKMASIGDAIWWSIVTTATVGYGDIVPVTVAGKFVATLLMIAGIGTIGLLASSLASVFVKQGDAGSVAAELERLAALRRDGHLSEDEFAQAKGKLLR